MIKKQKSLSLKVLFNASVVLSGINSPKGGSAYALNLAKDGKINAYISDIILDEILRHAAKIGYSKKDLVKITSDIFEKVSIAPDVKTVDKYKDIVIDEGDCHVLASAEHLGVDILLTLDKKHLLVLKDRFKKLKIFTPAELIEYLG